MKSVKTLGLLAIIGMATMAFAASASANPTLTSPKGTTYINAPLHAVNEGHIRWKPEQLAIVECTSTFEGSVTANGTPATGPLTVLNFTSCTNSWHVTVVSAGTFSVIKKAAGEGTVASTGATIEATRLGVTCRYVTNNTHIGILTDTTKTNATATLHLHGLIPFHSGSPLCGTGNSTWTGSYSVTNPMELYID